MRKRPGPTNTHRRHSALFSEPIVRATCGGVPVHGYGFTWILAGSPDLADDVRMQAGNARPLVKVRPKKSWEIVSNRLGGTAPRMPRTEPNDYLPLEAIHLIDGDATTCWSSKSQLQGAVEPVWIRLDLPLERTLRRIVLRKRVPVAPRRFAGSQRLDPGAVAIGRSMPAHLTIRVARDGLQWQTVFDGPSGDTPDRHEFACDLPDLAAKQIWIIGREVPRVENWLHSFSIAEVEVYDARGANVALASRGTGVTVSSTMHSLGQTRDEHHWLWPIHTDLGLKSCRVGYHDDPINWHWVEQRPGVLAVDAEADAAITYLVERGVDIVMALGFGNRHYTQPDPARHLPQLWEWYYENPAPPVTPRALKAWARYIRFMVRHFRDRVRTFEVWNEWNVECYWGAPVNVDDYLAVARTAIPIIRREAPRARVMLGSTSGFCFGLSAWTAAERARQEREHPLLRAAGALARDVDVVGWHPFYQMDPDCAAFRNYAADVRAFRAWCRQRGFRGDFIASEWTVGANYPPATPPNWWGGCEFSELQKAKLVAQIHVLHTALGLGSFFCETWSNTYPLDLSLLRRSFAADPITPQQPQAAYYVTRNLGTALEALRPAALDAEVRGHPAPLVCVALRRGRERVLALWQPGRPRDVCAGAPCELRVAGSFRRATGFDPLNGVEQQLRVSSAAGRTRIAGLRVRDYPLLVRLR
jgi:hypothetical protein